MLPAMRELLPQVGDRPPGVPRTCLEREGVRHARRRDAPGRPQRDRGHLHPALRPGEAAGADPPRGPGQGRPASPFGGFKKDPDMCRGARQWSLPVLTTLGNMTFYNVDLLEQAGRASAPHQLAGPLLELGPGAGDARRTTRRLGAAGRRARLPAGLRRQVRPRPGPTCGAATPRPRSGTPGASPGRAPGRPPRWWRRCSSTRTWPYRQPVSPRRGARRRSPCVRGRGGPVGQPAGWNIFALTAHDRPSSGGASRPCPGRRPTRPSASPTGC